MKTIYLSIFLTLIFFSGNLLVYSQEANLRKNNSDQPLFFTPTNHNPHFLKSAKAPGDSFYQSKSEWKHIIDTTWGPGAPLEEKLLIFNSYAQYVKDHFIGFHYLNLNYDSLYNHYLGQINEETSKGAFCSILNHFSYDLNDPGHTYATDTEVTKSALNPGVPVLITGMYFTVEHFGAVTTVLADTSTLVLRVTPNHPLGLEPGDLILGYEGVPWKDLVPELMAGGLPMMAANPAFESAHTYFYYAGAGMNWHLFNTIDILKYSTGDTLHLSVDPLLTLDIPPMNNNPQMPIENIPFPYIRMYPAVSDTVVTYGILENTNIGYIFAAMEYPDQLADDQFYEAVKALINTDGLIIDIRMNYGGMSMLSKGMSLLFNGRHITMEDAYVCNPTTYELCTLANRNFYMIEAGGDDSYDRPIAVLLGPSCSSTGENIAYNLTYHPMVRFFGKSTPGSISGMGGPSFPGWELSAGGVDTYHVNDPGNYLNGKEFPVDYPVWFNKEDVANGIDPIVEKSLEWINQLAYAHSLDFEQQLIVTGENTVRATATIENPESHDVLARLIFESLDGTVIDTTDMEAPNLNQETQWQATFAIDDLPENFNWVSLKVEDKTNGTYFTSRHTTQISTVPLQLDHLDRNDISTTKYAFRPHFKNAGKTLDIIGLGINLTANPGITTINPLKTNLTYLKPGQVRSTSAFTITIDTDTLTDLDLKFKVSSEGWTYWELDTTITLITDNEDIESLPLTLGLEQNFPNPFNSSTTIAWQLANGEKVTLSVFDLLGRKVATLVDGYRSPGRYETKINAATLQKGIYYYQLKAGKSVKTRKMIVVK